MKSLLLCLLALVVVVWFPAGAFCQDTHYSHNQRVVHVGHDDWRYGDGSFAVNPADKTLFQYRESTGELVEVRSVAAATPPGADTCTSKDCGKGGSCCQQTQACCGSGGCCSAQSHRTPVRTFLGRIFHRCR